MIRPVTYYEVACDEPGCGYKTGDNGGEFSAWAEDGGAADDWRDGGGVVLADGRTFCETHIPANHCTDSNDGHVFEDGECACGRAVTQGAPT